MLLWTLSACPAPDEHIEPVDSEPVSESAADSEADSETDSEAPTDSVPDDEPPVVQKVTVSPVELSGPIPNPRMGWLAYSFYPTTAPNSFAASEYSTVVYSNYWWWRDLEPDFDGDYRWDLLDDWIAARAAEGRQVAMGIHLSDPTSSPYCMELPDWLYAQVEGRWHDTFYGYAVTEACGWEFEPYYWDATLMEEHAELLDALADERASRPSWQDGLAWIDVSAYGYWGEWHSEITWPDSDTRQTTLAAYVDQYADAFEGDPLPLSMNVIDPYFEADGITYAIKEHGAQMVRRGIGFYAAVSEDEIAYMDDHADSRRIQGEFGSFTGGLNTGDFPDPETTTEDAVKDALEKRTSLLGWYVADPMQSQTETTTGETLEDYYQTRCGYRFVLDDVTFPSAVAPGGALMLDQTWTQKGVAGLREQMTLGAWLRDGDALYALGTDEHFNPASWPGGDPYWQPEAGPYGARSAFTVPDSVPDGTYTLEVAIVDASGEPAVNLAIEGKHTEDPMTWGRYALGEVEVSGLLEAEPPPTATSTATGVSVSTWRNDADLWVGGRIRVGEQDLRVVRVGRLAAGSRHIHELRVVEVGGETALATTLSMAWGEEAGAYRYGMADGVLRAGTEYDVFVQEAYAGDPWGDYDSQVTMSSELELLGPVWAVDVADPQFAAVPGTMYSPVDLVVEVAPN
ncbi:MAG: DUF4832 domain-containing protein [Proteobacteria bacterium]|nr:DUF4832 domain-containing protein [Pseudomonadota bacterium]